MPQNSLISKFPDIHLDWDFKKNNPLEPKNFSVLKSINERSTDFIEFIKSLLPDGNEDEHTLIIENYSSLIRGYLLKDIS